MRIPIPLPLMLLCRPARRSAGDPACGERGGASAAPALGSPPSASEIEAGEREILRRFLDEGPALLLPAAERERIALLPLAEGLAEARRFLAADPLPDTPENELASGIDRRQRLVWSEGLSLRDARGRLLFLRGEPRERTKVDCGDTFHPLEIWSYGTIETPRNAVLFRPRADAFYVLWRPTESKRALYMPEMEYYLEQWEELRGFLSGKRPDRVMCKPSETVDEVTRRFGPLRLQAEPSDRRHDGCPGRSAGGARALGERGGGHEAREDRPDSRSSRRA